MSSTTPSEVFVFCRVMGVFPVKNIGREKPKHLKLCPIWLAYSLLLVLFLTFACCYNLVWDLNDSFHSTYSNLTTRTGKVVMSCDILSMSVSSLVCVLAACKNCPQLIELYKELHNWDSLLKVKSVPCNMRVWMYVALACLTTVVSLDVIGRHLLYGMTPLQLSVFALHYTDLAVQLQYLSMVDCIRQRFRLVNQRIANQLTGQRFQGVLKLPPVERSTDDFAMTLPVTINSLSDLHWILCGLVHKTNAVFSCQVLFHVLCLFLHIIISPYFFFFTMNMHTQGVVPLNMLLSLLVQLLWVLVHSAKLVLLVWPCAATTQEANLTAPTVCKLLNWEMRPETKKQIAGAVTTYLVILIQFENADNNTNTAAL